MVSYTFYSYESLLDNLKKTYEARKKQYDESQHLYKGTDRNIREHLFGMEEDAFTHPKKDVCFNFDEFMNDLSNTETLYEYEDPSNTLSASERKHVCPKPGCNKSYTSSHGLKYHMAHGHSKEKENAYKPFVCPIQNCSKTYRNSNGLKYHMSKMHKHL
ncbi:hypothetical protein EHP00_448 [Ecytonucleospora hepatopenaei]|uniref:C2H2-type domain-containing protein n=1 Tax=Ecytonucleospora hepatopenaei TaxID=646526 RepID=A0A1W0E933_9MICR|nr:hypothetical protein EHP00_448 [Ecytonucleospora hepatopenaei]